ncbi:type IV pilus assembly protein PilZ [Gammaproteobacteria bacterium]
MIRNTQPGDKAGSMAGMPPLSSCAARVIFQEIITMSDAPRPTPTPPGARQGILSLTIKDKNALYLAYMPFLKTGGLFIPTTKSYQLGDEVFMLMNLMDEPDRLAVAGKVVWITPRGAQGNRTAGIGVQFSELDKGVVRSKIETYLAGTKADRPTHTL